MGTLTQVVKRTGAVVPFNPDRITNAIYRAAIAVGGRDRATAEGLARQVVELLEQSNPPDHIPTVEEIQDLVEKVLIENGHARTAKAYILYRNDRAERRRARARAEVRTDDNVPWRKIWEVLNWAVDHDLYTVELLNDRIARGEFGEIVRESDRAFNEDISTAAEMIAGRSRELRMVIIAGPSSSGKTTTTAKLAHLLSRHGLTLVPLTVDHYFYDLEMHPKDEHGDYDFETPQALDLGLINEHLQRLLAGEMVRIPFYDFKTGKRTLESTEMRVGRRDIILIDSLHGLYPDMTASIPVENKFRVYIEPLLQMRDAAGAYVRWTDLRLMRRMVRDSLHRAYDPQQTLEHWHYVRASELRNIIPRVHHADYIVNSGLPYELPVMAARLGDRFGQWAVKYQGDALRTDSLARATRVDALLRQVTPVADESEIPPDSLMREFIGGSCYE